MGQWVSETTGDNRIKIRDENMVGGKGFRFQLLEFMSLDLH